MSIGKGIRRNLGKTFKVFNGKRYIPAIAQDKVLSENTSFFIKEAYKSLRSNIIFSLSEAGCKKILVTSASATEGKSTTCVNTAIAFAEVGVRVCLIDCDLRRPSIGKLFDQKISPGLSNVLVRLNSINDVIRKNVYSNVDVIFSGDIPPNPTELLSSNKMKETLDELSQIYDYIFIDSPPVNVVTDASLLSKEVSGVLFVVRQNQTEKDDFIDAINQLEFANAKILGTVFNGTHVNNQMKYKYKRKGYYRYKEHGKKR